MCWPPASPGLLLGLLALTVIVPLKRLTRGVTSTSYVLCGIIAGYLAAIAMDPGCGLGATAGALAGLPQGGQLLTSGGSGIVPAAILAIVLNMAIPPVSGCRICGRPGCHS